MEIVLNFKIPEDIQIRLKQFMNDHQCGIWGSKFLMEYKEKFGEDLNIGNFGYGSLLHMCSEINYIVKVAKHFKGDFKMFPVKLDGNFTELDNIPKEIHFENLTEDDLRLPVDVVQYNAIIPYQQLHATNNSIPIKISYIYDPSKFWFYTAEGETKITDLNNNMQKFYTSTSKLYQIPTYQLRDKLYCSVFYFGTYHRCIIVNILVKLLDCVRVFFIDYGTVDDVKVNNVYFLHKSFKEPIAQILRGRIALAQPVGLNMPWSKPAVQLFEQLVSNKTMQAHIDDVKRVNDRFEYTFKLYDKSQDAGHWIHNKLIGHGLAIKVTATQDATQSIPEFVNNSQKMHLVPSFFHLESGIAPTRIQLHVLEKMNYPLHKLMKTYIQQ